MSQRIIDDFGRWAACIRISTMKDGVYGNFISERDSFDLSGNPRLKGMQLIICTNGDVHLNNENLCFIVGTLESLPTNQLADLKIKTNFHVTTTYHLNSGDRLERLDEAIIRLGERTHQVTVDIDICAVRKPTKEDESLVDEVASRARDDVQRHLPRLVCRDALRLTMSTKCMEYPTWEWGGLEGGLWEEGGWGEILHPDDFDNYGYGSD
ncbi:hypothetical protein EUX98_g6643 [Antrodiella citrinella]|uniref:Uncharacterized protein n=1 Tax=Antrodiella citrinella TaxID=2447956 RepID=A0A4S4MNH4_9APHY|nr:hypothetical protein EUX98_g6643 [Antrodiella citrinella]